MDSFRNVFHLRRSDEKCLILQSDCNLTHKSTFNSSQTRCFTMNDYFLSYQAMQIYFPKAQLDLVYIMMFCFRLGNSNDGNHIFTDTIRTLLCKAMQKWRIERVQIITEMTIVFLLSIAPSAMQSSHSYATHSRNVGTSLRVNWKHMHTYKVILFLRRLWRPPKCYQK